MKRKCTSLLNKWRSQERGSVAIMAGFTIPIVVGIAGLGLETSVWYGEKNRTQTAADFAAHAAAMELSINGPDQEMADAVAISQADQYGFAHTQLTTNVTEDSTGIRVDVSITQPVERYFSGIFDHSDLNVEATATALVESAGEACLLALDPNGYGVHLGGNTSMTMNNCLVASNSEADDGFEVKGSAELAATCGAVVGGADVNDSAVTYESCEETREGMAPVKDPYLGTPIPSTSLGAFASCVTAATGGGKGKGKGKKGGSGSTALKSGHYCGGLTFSGTQQIEDGATLVISGGRFKNQGPATLVGKNVTIILKNDAQVFLTSQADMDLEAKSTGDYAGLIFVGDAQTQSTNHRFAGGSASSLTGAVYLPTDEVELRGGANMTTGCLHFIAKEIDARGNSDMSNNCSGVGTKPLVVTGGVRMVKS